MELKGQVAIVTGAGRGIGRATAMELARQGADIVIAELDQAGAKRTAEEVGALGRRAVVAPTDVTSRADLRAMVDRAKAELGRASTSSSTTPASIAPPRPSTSPKSTGTRS